MTTIHVRFDSTTHPLATFTPDPLLAQDLEMSERVALGLACRWLAVQEDECGCEAPRTPVNRAQRRAMWGQDAPRFRFYVLHGPGCPATCDELARFLQQHRKELGG